MLGCSGGIGPGCRTTSLLVDDSLLIDAGTGVQELDAARMGRIRDVVLSHSHLDHVAGIPFLLDALYGRDCDAVTVHALPATIDALRRHLFNWIIWPDFSVLPQRDRPILRYRELAAGEHRLLNGVELETVPVAHSVPAVGFILHLAHSTVAFSGDTTANESLWRSLNRLKRLDVLIVEAAFPNREEALSQVAGHYCPRTLARDLVRLRHRPRIFLTHFKPGQEGTILDECREALPGWDLHPLSSGDVLRV